LTSWRDQSNLVAELRQHPTPMMGAAARLQPDQARRKLLEEGYQLGPPERLLQDDATCRIDGVNL
jgi:hypothetical protein